MKTILLAVALLAGFAQAAPQSGQPINAICPVKPRLKSRPAWFVVYEGQVIGFCCASCVPRFAADPKAYVANIPEFKPVERVPGPCAVEKAVRGLWCAGDQKEVLSSELKDGACPACGKKPARAEFCLKTADGAKMPDRAHVTYTCGGCTAVGDGDADFKHEESCKKKALKKICSKSGVAPHQTLVAK